MKASAFLQRVSELLVLVLAAGLPAGTKAWPRSRSQSDEGAAKASASAAKPTEEHVVSPSVSPVFAEGLRALEQSRFEQAIAAFQRALEIDPNLVTARYDLGVAYFALQKFDESRRALEEVLRQDPKHHFARYFLARVDLVQENLDAAICGFRALPQNKPVADELYYLGSAYFRKGDTQQATQTLEWAAASKPGDYRVRLLLARCYEKLGRKAEAERQYALSEKIRENYRGKSQAILGCHSALFTQFPQDPGTGVERCHELLDGDDPTKLVSLGVLLAERGLYAQAVAPLVKATQLDPENYEPYFNLGLTYFKMKDYGNARKSLEGAVALRSEPYEAVALLGSALFALGDDYNAVEQLRHAHELRPSDEKMSALLFEELKIIAQHLLAEKQYKQSIPYFEEALSLKPGAAELHLQLAEVYRALGDAASAAKEQQASGATP